MIVVKVGGSLLDLPDLGARLRRVIDQLGAGDVVLFPGGGPTADLVRDWQRQFAFDDDAAHEMAIQALELNAHLLRQVLAGSRLAHNRLMVKHDASRKRISVLAPKHALFELEQKVPDDAPPHTWDVTSDSLAAWVAIHWGAELLVLLKSAPISSSLSVTAATQQGLVDPYFSGLAGQIPRIQWCALRSEAPTLTAWLTFGESRPDSAD